MVSDILIFTQGARLDTHLKRGDYRAFVLDLINDLRSEAEMKSVQLEMQNVPPAVAVAFDPRRLSRVFFNLAGNATDIMLNGGKIFLRFKLTENEVVTEFEDTGPGIAPEIADKPRAPASASPSAKKSSKTTAGKSPRAASRDAARFFPSHCRWRNDR